MNKIFKIIWNRTSQQFVVVSELCKSSQVKSSQVKSSQVKSEFGDC
ncbi:ESPR domain-containing protein [Chelonobacter oris]